jgi:hypothetical protein
MALRAALCIIGILLWSGATNAAGDRIPKPDPKGVWREITQTTATNKCLGDPKTPVCAVETMLAYRLRGDPKFGELVWPSGDSEVKALFEAHEHPRAWSWYRVVFVKRFTGPHDYPNWHLFLQDYQFVPGDVRVDLNERIYDWPDSCCARHSAQLPPTTYVTRRSGDHWIIVDWSAPNSDDWEDYMKRKLHPRAAPEEPQRK